LDKSNVVFELLSRLTVPVTERVPITLIKHFLVPLPAVVERLPFIDKVLLIGIINELVVPLLVLTIVIVEHCALAMSTVRTAPLLTFIKSALVGVVAKALQF
jgi:hypothetical protein